MSEKRKIYKPSPVSGFPEWLPQVRRVEQQWMDHIRRIFESYGFCSIETPAIEELDVIKAKGGDTDNEIYVLERLHKEEGDKAARLALHFDQTVPLARYVAQHYNELVFPFKRYQMQKVWRGERPQAGRFREFYQCDIDVINVDQLPLHFDAEMPAIIWKVLSSLPGMEGEKIQLRISNRKILIGLCGTLNINNIVEVTRAIDKIEKIGDEAVIELLLEHGINDKQCKKLLELAKIKTSPSNISELLRDFITHNDIVAKSASDAATKTLKEGISELETVVSQFSHLPKGTVVADLSIVRGLDYYTGTVYETVFVDDPGYGSICSGGRYDDLASSYINKALPGVGISIGFSRLFDRLRVKGKFDTSRISPTDVLVVLPREEQRGLANKTAQTLRERGFNVETFHSPAKIKNQMKYAERRAIPYVWFPPFEDGKPHEVKCMNTSEQVEADLNNWSCNEK